MARHPDVFILVSFLVPLAAGCDHQGRRADGREAIDPEMGGRRGGASQAGGSPGTAGSSGAGGADPEGVGPGGGAGGTGGGLDAGGAGSPGTRARAALPDVPIPPEGDLWPLLPVCTPAAIQPN